MPSVLLPSETLKVFPPLSCLPALTTHVAFFPSTTLILIHLTTLHTTNNQQAKQTNQRHSGTVAAKHLPNVPLASKGKERKSERKKSQLTPLFLLYRLVLETSKILLHGEDATAAAGPT